MKKFTWPLKISLAVWPLFLFVILSLNVSGYCMDSMRYISDNERINNAVNALLQNYPSLTQEEISNGAVSYSYQNTNEFMKNNPNCCLITKFNEENGYKTGFLSHKIWGQDGGFVSISYKKSYKNLNGTVMPFISVASYGQTNCANTRHPF